jgi:hypothetical protein
MYQGVTPSLDPAFQSALKTFDKSLWVEFSREASRFIIYQKSEQHSKAQVMVIETEEGEFRQPNDLDIAMLYWGDLWRHGGPEARMIFGEEKALKQMDDDEKRAETEFRDATKDNKYWLRRKLLEATGQVADAPHVRRVELKPRGYKVIDKRKWKVDHLNQSMDS